MVFFPVILLILLPLLQCPNIDTDTDYNLQGRSEDVTQGGTGDDRINSQSDGTYKDQRDGMNEKPIQPDLEKSSITPDISQTNIGPSERDEDTMRKMTGGSEPIVDGKAQILGSPDNDENPLVPSEGMPNDFDKEAQTPNTDLQDSQQVEPQLDIHDAEHEEKAKQLGVDPLEVPDRDAVADNDPMTSGISDSTVDPDNPENIEPNAGSKLPQLQDKPLFETPKNEQDIPQEPIQEDPQDLGQTDGIKTVDGPIDKIAHPPEETQPDSVPVQDSENPQIDNTGLNMTPDGEPDVSKSQIPEERTSIRKEPQLGQSFPDGDGNIFDGDKDIRQVEPPQITSKDPETGRNYTNQLDEQGNPIPDLRFDQTPDSDEDQPEIETKDEEIEAPMDEIPTQQGGQQSNTGQTGKDIAEDEAPDQMELEKPDQTPKPGLGFNKKPEDLGKENVSGPSADSHMVATKSDVNKQKKKKLTESKKPKKTIKGKKSGKGKKRKK